MRYRRCECKKNPRRRKNPFVEGETVVRDHGGGAYGGSYTYYKVLKVHADGTADLFNTGSGQTFKNVSEGGLLDRRTLEPIWKRKNPSAVYGAFRANPEETGWMYAIIDPTPVKIRQTVNRLLTEYKAHWHLPDRYDYARSLAKLLDEYPWVGDQIPWDVLGIIRADVKQRSARKNPAETRHFSSRRLSEVLTRLRYTEKDTEEAKRAAISSNNRRDFDKYDKQFQTAKKWRTFLESQIKRSSPSGAWQATYEFNAVPRGATYNQRVVAARKIQKQAGEAIARVLSKHQRFAP